MSILTNHMLMAAAGARGGALSVADVFSTDLYTGNSSVQTITNGIDLAGEGGLVWGKGRSTTANHFLFDSDRGIDRSLSSNLSDAEATGLTTYVTAFNSDGFSLGSGFHLNQPSQTYAAWTFRKAPKFFDIVTYTGDSVAGRTISHDLGVEPGMIVVKWRDGTTDWVVWHKDEMQDPTYAAFLNTNSAYSDIGVNIFGSDVFMDMNDTTFTVGDWVGVNRSGETYVAYLFAHDDDIIQCGSYTADAAGNASVSLGWEPQWVIVKRTNSTGSWYMLDTARGWASGNDPFLIAQSSGAETTGLNLGEPTSTGFDVAGMGDGDFIYMAIRAEGV